MSRREFSANSVGAMARSSIHTPVCVALMLLVCESSCERQTRPFDRETPTVAAVASTDPAGLGERTSCTKPDLEATLPATMKRLGSGPVQLSFSAPRLLGRDAPVLEQQVDSIAKQILANREREWKECPTASPLGYECFPWNIESKCEAVAAGSVFSIICMNRLSDEHSVRPIVDYKAVHASTCGGTLRILGFEKDLCPSWKCLDTLHEVFLTKGLEGKPLGAESSHAKLEAITQQFYFTNDHIVFLMGDVGIGKLDYDDRFLFGYNIIALTHADMVRVSPEALSFLREVGLAPRAENHVEVQQRK